jgi:GT2 family glycosyltransferase
MKVSLLIATRDRRASLARCLDAVERAERPWPLEVVVVDNGSRDGTEAFLEEYARAAPYTLQPVREPRTGKSRALNAGLARTTGDIIAFIDDDVYLSPDYFVRLVEIFERNEVGYCGGRILLHDPTDLAITVRTTTKLERIPPRGFITAGVIQGCNMAFRRGVLEAIGGFDPMLGPGTPFICEDLDLAARASAAGWGGGYFPDLLVYHHHGRKTRAQEAALVRSYSLGRGAYFAKFILDPRTRHQYLRRCYWHWRSLSFRMLRPEVEGAVRYVLTRFFTRAERIPSVPEMPSEAPGRPARAG